MKLEEGFLARMREATALLQSQGPAAATQAIQEALRGATSRSNHPGQPAEAQAGQSSAQAAAGSAARAATVASRWKSTQDTQPITDVYVDDALEAGNADTARTSPAASGAKAGAGRFIQASFSSPAGRRDYKVYIPSAYAGQALPLVVMLHGCKQDPDDFAVGTGMNLLAEQNDCFVVYPAQAQRANGSNCWNWFQSQDQLRDRGEPSIIADITRQVVDQYGLDATRCYVAGLSAGGAMAAIMGRAYPDLYAAVGVHSGLPAGAAHDVMSAFNAMRQGAAPVSGRKSGVPIIVFHGDRDTTVHPQNGKQVIEQYSGAATDRASPQGGVIEQKGRTPQGRAFTTSIYRDSEGRVTAEFWDLHGVGHAWSGGSSMGSYTDPAGPDASREMLRFFQAHNLKGVKS